MKALTTFIVLLVLSSMVSGCFTKNDTVNDDKIYYSSGGYLRAVRPSQKYSENEYLNWHRETFYGKKKFIQYGVNVWIPVMNVSNLKLLATSNEDLRVVAAHLQDAIVSTQDIANLKQNRIFLVQLN